jgi:chromate transporter
LSEHIPTESKIDIRKPVRLLEIAKVFLTIGSIGFGGGIAIIALMQDYCVTRRRWLEPDEFTHGVAFGQILGAFAVNTSIFVGYRLRGLAGALVAVISFLAPSVVVVMILTDLYLHYQKIPSLQTALSAIGPVVIALIIAAAYQMGKNKIKSLESILLMFISIILVAFLKLPIVIVLLTTACYALLKIKFIKGGSPDEGS